MKRYEFYRNQKITVIDCRYFSFEAENLETAVQKIKELCADGQLDELSNDPTYQEDVAYQIPGTEYPLDIENNNGDPTVMIYSAADGTRITDNLPISTGITQMLVDACEAWWNRQFAEEQIRIRKESAQ